MNHYLIKIAYDGLSFDGWQRLKDNSNTIQQTIETALSTITHETIRITGSGRTDAGVHATSQYADFRCNADLLTTSHKEALPAHTDTSSKNSKTYTDSFLCKCNNILPSAVRITNISVVGSNFHTRKNCTAKTYTYSISCTAKPDVFSARYVYNPANTPVNYQPDTMISYSIAAMQKAANYLIGEHDFSSFTADKTPDKSHIRRIDNIQITYKNTPSNQQILELSFTGNGFLYNMVRILAGTVLFCGLDQLDPDQIPHIISARQRSSNPAPTLPGNALCLSDVQFRI